MKELLISLIIYFLIVTFLSIFSMKYLRRTSEGFFIAGREIGGFVASLTYAATTYSAFMMVGLVGFSYLTGVGALGFELVYLVGTIMLLTLLGEKIWKISREKGYITPAEFFAKEFGSVFLSIFITLMCLISLIPYISIQFIGTGLLLERVFGLKFSFGILIASIIIIITTLTSGMRSVAWTDSLLGILMIFSSLILLTWFLNHFGVENISSGIYEAKDILKFPNNFWSFEKFIIFITPWFFFAITNPQVFQRLFIPKDEKSLRNMIVYFSIYGFIYTLFVTFFGISLRGLSEIGLFEKISDRDLVMPTLLSIAPIPLAILVILGIISAAATTANSILLTLSSMIVRDFILNFKRVRENEQIILGRIFVILFLPVIIYFSFLRPGFIVELAVLSSTLLLPLVPILIAIIMDKKDKISAILTVLLGYILALILSILKFKLYPIIILIISTLIYLISYKIRR